MINKIITLFILPVIIFGFSRCSPLITIVKQGVKGQSSTILSGRILGNKDIKGPIIVMAYQKTDEEITTEQYTYLNAPGSYKLLVDEGNYFLFAFEDKNKDKVYNLNEYAGQ